MNKFGDYEDSPRTRRFGWRGHRKGVIGFECRTNLNLEREMSAHRVQDKRRKEVGRGRTRDIVGIPRPKVQ